MNPQTTYQAWVAISQAAITLERAVDQRLRPVKLNASQGMSLLVLEQHGPQRMSYLARFLLQQTQTTTDLVDRLERRGLVRRIRHDTDRRVVLVEITDVGKGLINDISAAVYSVSEESIGKLSDREVTQMVASAKKVRDIAAAAGNVPADHLNYAEERLAIAAS